MRTTVNLADDVLAAVERVRRERSIGLSEALNDLVRAGLTAAPATAAPFVQRSHDLGDAPPIDDIADVLETIDGPAAS